ncbi:MAG: hypothetical protein KGI67_03420 [Pseudomonadota bacterium]|nr:hypothetical protein [Pseudomonadota bacterium]
MNSILKRSAGMAAGVLLVGITAQFAFGDCARSPRAGESVGTAVAAVHGESAMSLSDPVLDGLIGRYADLHRDAVGYAVDDSVAAPIYANAVPAVSAPITR